MTDREFLIVWAAWDDKPRDAAHAVAMEDACIAVASGLTLRTTDFRALLAAWRRAGHARSEALLAVQAGVLARS